MPAALSHLARLARTLRPLRPSQLAWRGRYAVARRLPLRRATCRRNSERLPRAPRLDGFPDVPVVYRPSPAGADSLRRLAAGEFSFLNRSEPIGGEIDWKLGPQTTGRLWAITLHYHAWAYELAEGVRRGGTLAGAAEGAFIRFVSDWIERCGLEASGARHLAWNAYAIATRIGWWIRAYRALGPAWWQAHADFDRQFLTSLERQADYLAAHLEWDLRGNHLLRDAVGVAWAGRFFQGQPARGWLDLATRLACEQVREQVLCDGGHFERSPMYHLQIMEDVLALTLLVNDEPARAELRSTWERMAEYAAWMQHPDGGIPLLNDAAFNGAAALDQVLAAGRHLGVDGEPRRPSGGRHFRETGTIVWHGAPWSIFFDVGPVGPDVQPGHAHADTLTLECSCAGRRLFVDPGTYGYDLDARRQSDRSTAAHNTVAIDGRDSSEVWHIFRVGARAIPRDVRVAFTPDGLVAMAEHDGYDALPGRPRHRRTAIVEGRELRIVDSIEGGGEHLVEGGWLLEPAWTAAAASHGWLLNCRGRRTQFHSVRQSTEPTDVRGRSGRSRTQSHGSPAMRVTVSGPDDVQLVARPAVYHPEFGLEHITTRLCWRYFGRLPIEVTTVIEPAC